jgi:hypothetical protein
MSGKYVPFHELLDEEHLLNYFGYQVFRHGNMESFYDLKEKFTNHLKNKLISFSGDAKIADSFKIEKYHKVIDEKNIDHDAFIKKYGRNLDIGIETHPFLIELIKIAEKSTNQNLRVYRNNIEFRVVRPGSNDNNPMHRDHWFPYFTPLLNIYLPLSGSYFNSSLAVVPFSHKWTDQEIVPTLTYDDILKGKKTLKENGVKTSVPKIKETSKDITMHRPDVLEGDFMLFSPMSVHGGGNNEGFDTRFSLEIRLEIVS